MKKPKTDFKRGLSKTETRIYKFLYTVLCLLFALVFIMYPSEVLHSFVIKIVYLLAFVAFVVVLFFVLWLLTCCQDKWRGYSIQLNGNGDGGGVDYREGKNGLALDFYRSPLVIHIPSDEVWNRDAPAWAKDRRADIIGRIKKQYKNAQYKEGGGVYNLNFDKSKAMELDALLEMKKSEEGNEKSEDRS